MLIGMTQCLFQIKVSKFYSSKKMTHLDHVSDYKMFTFSTKTVIEQPKIDLQTSVRPIWNPENQGYKIGNKKS